MNWVRPAEVVVAVGVLTTFTDWLIAGDWLQKQFGDPEIWRAKVRLFSVAGCYCNALCNLRRVFCAACLQVRPSRAEQLHQAGRGHLGDRTAAYDRLQHDFSHPLSRPLQYSMLCPGWSSS